MKLRNLLPEQKVKIKDLDIETHGKPDGRGYYTLTAPSDRDVELGFFSNRIGAVDLRNWIEVMSKTYGIKDVTVKDGKVTVSNNKFKKAKEDFAKGKLKTLKGWGTTE